MHAHVIFPRQHPFFISPLTVPKCPEENHLYRLSVLDGKCEHVPLEDPSVSCYAVLARPPGENGDGEEFGTEEGVIHGRSWRIFVKYRKQKNSVEYLTKRVECVRLV